MIFVSAREACGNRYLFIGEEHNDSRHIQSLVGLVRNSVLRHSGVTSLYLEYFLSGDSPVGMSETQILHYLKKRSFLWHPKQALWVRLIAEACVTTGIRIEGLDAQTPPDYKLPIYMWRASSKLHALWRESLTKKQDVGVKLIYGGRLHGPLLRKKELPNLISYELGRDGYSIYF